MKGFAKTPSFHVEPVKITEVAHLFREHHAYAGASHVSTYVLAVREDGEAKAAFTWMPPAPGAAKAVCGGAPYAVLALSRMVAVPREARRFNLARVLKWIMRNAIDRVRWPCLVTYSDEGLGHTGATYRMSGWRPTVRTLAAQYTRDGRRTSAYSGGRFSRDNLDYLGTAFIQRWEHFACPREEIQPRMEAAGWRRVAVPGKVWRSGNPAMRWVKQEEEA